MSYSIRYGPDRPRSAPKKRSYFGLVGVVLVIMVCAVAIGWSIPQQAEQFKQALLPWTRSEVRAAFADLQENVREGQPLQDALTAFCLEIIHDTEPIQ